MIKQIRLTCLRLLLSAVVTGATSGIGKAYANEVSLQFPSTATSLHFLVHILSFEPGTAKWYLWSWFRSSVSVFTAAESYCGLRKLPNLSVCMFLCKLARRGLDVVLVSRSNDKLQMAAKEIGESNENNTLYSCVDTNVFPCAALEQIQQSKNILCVLQRISMDERLAPSKWTSQTGTASTLL